ncbi:hypothetical protein BDR04DRAFT_1109066 [Suillus decipiens]|nr:hypothetical protein BDR04DRAFT_1109066 [Suillus decipiens]
MDYLNLGSEEFSLNIKLYNRHSPQCLKRHQSRYTIIISLMFSTTRSPWQCQWVSTSGSNPTVSPPALHNARYAGWPHPPIQLPHVASPSPTTVIRHIAVANNTPSHRPEFNAPYTQPYHVHPITNFCSYHFLSLRACHKFKVNSFD